MSLSPYAPTWYLVVDAQAAYWSEQFERAVASSQKVFERKDGGRLERFAWIVLIAGLMELGREEEARAEVRKYLERDAKFSVSKHSKKRRQRYRDPAMFDRFMGRLQAAGLPQ